jgi:hypothetical protein
VICYCQAKKLFFPVPEKVSGYFHSITSNSTGGIKRTSTKPKILKNHLLNKTFKSRLSRLQPVNFWRNVIIASEHPVQCADFKNSAEVAAADLTRLPAPVGHRDDLTEGDLLRVSKERKELSLL